MKMIHAMKKEMTIIRVPGADGYHKQFTKPNMPTHWMPIHSND